MDWRQKWEILKLVFGVLLRGGKLAEQVIAAAEGKAPPEEHPMSAYQVFTGIIKALVQDKTWDQVEHMAKTADKVLKSGDLLVQVVKEHGKVAQNDVKLGLEVATVLAPNLAANLVGFLSGPAGGPAMALFSFWLNGLLTGKPIQPKDPAYNAPAGGANMNVNTGA